MHSLETIRKYKRIIFLFVVFSYASVTCQFFFKEFCHFILHAKDYICMQEKIHSSHSHEKIWNHTHDNLDTFFQLIENQEDKSQNLPSSNVNVDIKNIVHLRSNVFIHEYIIILTKQIFTWLDSNSLFIPEINTPPPQA